MIVTSEQVIFDLEVTVNGQLYRSRVPTHLRLIDYLRDTIDLTGTKESCGEGECGSCTVIMDGKTVNSCLILAVEAHGSRIITVEGVGVNGHMSVVQKAFIEEHAVQCGYCTPGLILSATQLLADDPNPDRDTIKAGLAGNICRCTGYQKIITAVETAGLQSK